MTGSPSVADVASDSFLSVLPAIQRYARWAFRHLRAADREEAAAETVAVAFRAFGRLRVRGKDPTLFPISLARYSALAVCNGRRAGSAMASRDVTAGRYRRDGARLLSYDEAESGTPSAADVLAVGTGNRVPDSVAFGIDFPVWLARLPRLRRRVALLLAAGYGTGEVAVRTGVSAGRVSQLRCTLAADWDQFHAGEYGSERDD